MGWGTLQVHEHHPPWLEPAVAFQDSWRQQIETLTQSIIWIYNYSHWLDNLALASLLHMHHWQLRRSLTAFKKLTKEDVQACQTEDPRKGWRRFGSSSPCAGASCSIAFGTHDITQWVSESCKSGSQLSWPFMLVGQCRNKSMTTT